MHLIGMQKDEEVLVGEMGRILNKGVVEQPGRLSQKNVIGAAGVALEAAIKTEARVDKTAAGLGQRDKPLLLHRFRQQRQVGRDR